MTSPSAAPWEPGKELFAALSTAVISLPGNIVFGMIAFAPLGPSYVSMGILSGWICSIVLGGFSALFSPTTGLISGPRAGVCLAVAAFLGHQLAASPELPLNQLLSLLFILLLIAGVIQTLLGLLKLGDIIKFISYPVIVGVINSKVLLLLKSQVWNMIGLEKSGAFSTALSHINPYALGLSILTVLLFFILKKLIRRLPVHILVIILGCLIHHMLIRLGISSHPGGTLDSIELNYRNLFYFSSSPEIFGNGLFSASLSGILITAFSIAILSSTDTLLSSLAIQNITYESVDANRELVVQGIGNVLTVFCGGLVGGGSSTRSMTNVLCGSRSRASAVIYALLVLVIATVLRPLIRFVPLSVIAGLVIIIAFNMFDRWLIDMCRSLWSRKTGLNTAALGNLMIILMVIAITFLGNLISAVLAGMAISFILYVYRKSKVSMLRKIYTGAGLRSKTQRPTRDMEILSAHGDEIYLAVLEGSLFFGTADELSERIDQLIRRGGRYIILDLKRISDIDSSGVKILERMSAKSQALGCKILFSYLLENSHLWGDLQELGMSVDRESFFPDSDSALEFCEDRLLERYGHGDTGHSRIRFDVFRDCSAQDMAVLQGLLSRKSFFGGELICRQGDPGDSLYLIASGAAVITINLPGGRGEKKLETLCSGTLFGEMGLIEGKSRSANVRALGETVCLILDSEGFEKIKLYHPGIYVKMMNNILKIVSSRLRYANITISELES